jgi:hypothetical protein
MTYKKPIVDESSFNCPYCLAFSSMHWSNVNVTITGGYASTGGKVCQCKHCNKWSYWIGETKLKDVKNNPLILWRMVYPNQVSAPMPSSDLPECCFVDYMEARQVLSTSPRAAAALLRLCIQKLCKEFGEKGKNINEDIASLVKKGLDSRLQKALDIVRVTGNNAVHPGEMNIEDNPEVSEKLFKLVNLVVEELITKPKEIEALYGELPEGSLKSIEKRDQE